MSFFSQVFGSGDGADSNGQPVDPKKQRERERRREHNRKMRDVDNTVTELEQMRAAYLEQASESQRNLGAAAREYKARPNEDALRRIHEHAAAVATAKNSANHVAESLETARSLKSTVDDATLARKLAAMQSNVTATVRGLVDPNIVDNVYEDSADLEEAHSEIKSTTAALRESTKRVQRNTTNKYTMNDVMLDALREAGIDDTLRDAGVLGDVIPGLALEQPVAAAASSSAAPAAREPIAASGPAPSSNSTPPAAAVAAPPVAAPAPAATSTTQQEIQSLEAQLQALLQGNAP